MNVGLNQRRCHAFSDFLCPSSHPIRIVPFPLSHYMLLGTRVQYKSMAVLVVSATSGGGMLPGPKGTFVPKQLVVVIRLQRFLPIVWLSVKKRRV